MELDHEKTERHINKFGFSVVMVEASAYLPPFAYTIGLEQSYNHSELICFGLKTDLLHAILNLTADLIKKGSDISTREEYRNIFKGNRAMFLKVDKRNLGDYFGGAIEYYGSRNFSALQLIWADKENKFPWEPKFQEEFRFFQPLLDRNADFKFREEKNLGVFTTSHFVEQNEPILKVVHDHNGDWQFLTKEIDFENPKLISLDKMVETDNTLNEIFDLEYGEEAEREFVSGKWVRNSFEEDKG